jgi:hypothetical protein
MRRFIDGEDRMQPALLPHCLEDYVDEENPVRVIEVMVWTTAATGIEYLRVVAAVTPHSGGYRDGDCYCRS